MDWQDSFLKIGNFFRNDINAGNLHAEFGKTGT